jgi:transposase
MKTTRRRYDADFKAQVAMDAIHGIKTLAELANEHQIHPGQIQAWKKHLQAEAATLFEDGRRKVEESGRERLVDALYGKIGRLEVELDFLKKRTGAGPWRRVGP